MGRKVTGRGTEGIVGWELGCEEQPLYANIDEGKFSKCAGMVRCECRLSLTIWVAAFRHRANKQYRWMSVKQTTTKAPGKADEKRE